MRWLQCMPCCMQLYFRLAECQYSCVTCLRSNRSSGGNLGRQISGLLIDCEKFFVAYWRGVENVRRPCLWTLDRLFVAHPQPMTGGEMWYEIRQWVVSNSDIISYGVHKCYVIFNNHYNWSIWYYSHHNQAIIISGLSEIINLHNITGLI